MSPTLIALETGYADAAARCVSCEVCASALLVAVIATEGENVTAAVPWPGRAQRDSRGARNREKRNALQYFSQKTDLVLK